MMPPKAESFEVTDASSDLFDQLSYLWGTLNFKNMADPNNSSDAAHLAYHTVFDGNPFPAPMAQTGVPGPFDLMKGTSKIIFMNLMAMHFNGTEGTFVNTSGLANGAATPGNDISTLNAGYLTMVLVKMKEEFSGTPLEPMIINAITAQSDFIANMLKDPNGGFYNGYTIGTGNDNSAKTAVSQAAVARGLYAAYDLTGNNDYLNAADEAYNFLIDNYYVPQLMGFKTEYGNNMATYTPFNFAVITGALREAVLVGGHTEGATIYTRFFKKVVNAMQLAEFDPTGETGNDSDGDGIPFLPEQPDGLAPVFAAEAQYNLDISGIEDIISGAADGVSIYPNPATENVTVSFIIKQQANVTIEAVDFTGRTISTIVNRQLSKGAHRSIWNTNALPNGIYFVRVSIPGSGSISKKVVVL